MKLSEMFDELAAAVEEEDLSRRRLLFSSLVAAVNQLGGEHLARRLQARPMDFQPCHQTADFQTVVYGREYGERVRRTMLGVWTRYMFASTTAAEQLRQIAAELREREGAPPAASEEVARA